MTIATALAAFDRKNYFLDERDFALNLFGVRSPSRSAGDSFDDQIIALMKVDGEWFKEEWPATVDASLKYLKNPINRNGTAGLVPGQYLDIWKIDDHNGWVETLCQRNGPVRVYRDSNRDSNLDYKDSTIQSGNFGINFHPGSSAGCQTFKKTRHHKQMMKLAYKHQRLVSDKFSYTLFNYKDFFETVDEFSPKEDDFRLWADWVVAKEARRDSKGNVAVFNLKQGSDGDGGGKYEVCGINDRYHPKAARELKGLVESGQYSEAENFAKDYIRSYTSMVEDWHPDTKVVFFLRDCAFNRGPTGAGKIYQIALNSAGLKTGRKNGKVGPLVKAAGAKLAAEDLIFRLVMARQTYEREKGRDESSDFWEGLSNRWVDCGQLAMGVGDPLRFGK